MEEIIRFLADQPPFSQLAPEQVQQIAAKMQIEYFAVGRDILTQGAEPAQFLYLIRRGSVDLLRVDGAAFEVIDTLEAGELFGYVSLVRAGPPTVTVRAREETLAYLLPKAQFDALRRDLPAFAQFFAHSIGARLERALQAQHAAADPALFQTRLRDLIQREPVAIAPDASVGEAARLMRDRNVSCLIVAQTPPGILTDRDLRNRVLAEGRSDATPVAEVMSAPAALLPADSLVFEALLLMQERGIHHLLVGGQQRIVGVVTNTDIVRRASNNPSFLPRQLQRAQTLDELRDYAEQITATVGTLLESGARIGDIGRMVAVAHDALLQRLLRDAEAALGAPPCPYAWLVLGSEGRFEQTLRTDQDNALVYADDAPPDADSYFAQLATRVVEQLVACGFPRCPGEIMASNPLWRQPLATWQSYFRDWIAMPDPEALLRVTIFFDYRRVHGALDAEAGLRPTIAEAADNRIFLGRLARTALHQGAPIGWFRRLITEREGDQGDVIDLKERGTALIVDLARLHALEANVAVTNTLARLRAAAQHGSLSTTGASELAAAFELISMLRLRHQYRQLQHGAPPTNTVPLDELNALERRELKEALRIVARMQESIEVDYQTALFG